MSASGAGQVAGVVLAAGGSSRMGRPKQLIVHEGEPLVTRAAAAALEAGARPVIVVLGADADEIRPALTGLDGVIVVVNSEWETGLASSLTAGLRAALQSDACTGVLVLLADQPLVSAALLRRLIDAFHRGSRIVASGYDGEPGAPALFAREHAPALLGLTGDAGAGAWLRSRAGDVTIVPLDGARLDVDTPADAARLAGGPGSS